MVLVVTPYMRIRHKIEGIEGIEGNQFFRVEEICRNLGTIALAKFFPSSRVRSGFGGLSCRRSGGSERGPSMIDDCAFFGYFFIFLASTVRIPLFKRIGHIEKWADFYIIEKIYIDRFVVQRRNTLTVLIFLDVLCFFFLSIVSLEMRKRFRQVVGEKIELGAAGLANDLAKLKKENTAQENWHCPKRSWLHQFYEPQSDNRNFGRTPVWDHDTDFDNTMILL